MDNHWRKKQRTIKQRRPKKLPFLFINVYYSVVKTLQAPGKSGWYSQVCSQAACPDFMVELQDVICHGQDSPFSVYLDAPPEKETPKIHVLFCHGKRPLGLYATVDPKKFTKGSINHDLHFLPLLCKTLGDIQSFATLLQRKFAIALDALVLQRATLALGTFVHGRFQGETCQGFCFPDVIKYQALSVGTGVGISLRVCPGWYAVPHPAPYQ